MYLRRARNAADMVGNLGRQSACRCRAGTGDLRGAGDLPTLTHADVGQWSGRSVLRSVSIEKPVQEIGEV